MVDVSTLPRSSTISTGKSGAKYVASDIKNENAAPDDPTPQLFAGDTRQ